MFVRVKEQGGSLAFVLVKSEREGAKIKQRFICHLGSFPKGHDLTTYDWAYSCFLQKMHLEVGRLDLNPIRKRKLYETIWGKIGKARKQLRHEAKRRL